jgi:Protein of unknown function (DUF2975)
MEDLMKGKRSVSSALGVLLNVGWYGVAAGMVLIGCLVAMSAFVDLSHTSMDIPVSFSVDGRTVHVTDAADGVEGAQVRDVRSTGYLKFSPPSRPFLAAAAISLFLMLALVLWVLGQLIAVVRTLRDGRPFVAGNATRIRAIGYAVIAGELARSVLMLIGNRYAMAHFSAEGLRFLAWPDIDVLALVHGLIILAIAEVFRLGTRLDEDQSLTV